MRSRFKRVQDLVATKRGWLDVSQKGSRRTLVFVAASALVAVTVGNLAPSASAVVVNATATVASCSANATVYTSAALAATSDTVAVTFDSNCNGATVTATNFSGGTSPVAAGGPVYTYTATATPASGTLITIVKAGKTVLIVNFGGASPTEIAKVTICHRTHATTNPYVLITVSVNSVIGSGGGNGHSDHDTSRTNKVNPFGTPSYAGSGPFQSGASYTSNKKWWGDIIPPFYYATGNYYPGLNWAPEWPVPGSTLQSGTTYWMTDSNFGTATTLATADTNYQSAVALCKGASGTTGVPTAQALYDLEVNAGESPADAAAEIADIDGGTNPYGGGAVPNASSLAAAFTGKVTTVAASSVAQTQAQLNGTLGLTSPTSAKFEYGTSSTGVLTSTTPVSSPSTPTSAVVTGLTCGTTYYFRVVGTNSTATYYGQFLSFATAACDSGGGSSGGGSSSGGGGSSTPSATPSATPTPAVTTSPGVGPVKKPETEKVKPGKEVTLIDGEPTKTEKKKDDKSTKVEISGPEFEVKLGGTTPAGAPLPLSPTGAPIVTPLEKIATSGTGCAPATSVELYLLSPLTLLGTIPVSGDGTYAGSVGLPAGLPAGDYVLQSNCFTTTAQVRSVSVGMTVRSASLVLCTTGSASSTDCTKVPQRPRAGVIILPDELVGGRNLLLPTRIRMNSGQFGDVKVLCSPVTRSVPVGDVAYCMTTREGKQTYVLVRPNTRMRATVIVTAPETAKYAAYKYTKKYTIR